METSQNEDDPAAPPGFRWRQTRQMVGMDDYGYKTPSGTGRLLARGNQTDETDSQYIRIGTVVYVKKDEVGIEEGYMCTIVRSSSGGDGGDEMKK